MKKGENEENKPGPDPERLKIEKKDWKEALKKALRKKPKEGWSDKGDNDSAPA